LMYGSEIWILTNRSLQNIESAEMRFLISTKIFTRLDKISNHDIRPELGV
jgi:hypothetical protein